MFGGYISSNLEAMKSEAIPTNCNLFLLMGIWER